MSTDLKPCPFCGSATTLDDERLLWVASCTGCGACVLGDRAPEPEQEMPAAYWEPFRQSAVDRWNRRAALDAHPEPEARPEDEYHEDMGAVLWWRFPIDEPPYCGSPLDSEWPGYHTHFTPLGPMPIPANNTKEEG
jgi:hypothetical protein